MLEPDQLPPLREAMRRRAEADRRLLDELRREIAAHRSAVQRIQPRSATAVSLVASDGGNNKIQFDPFLMQIVRVVDSYGQQLFLDVVSPTTDTDELSDRQFDANGTPATPLGTMMIALGVRKLYDLSPMIPRPATGDNEGAVSPSWVLVYRDLCEWAVLYDRIVNTHFATDTLIVRDGFLRSKIFKGELFITLRELLRRAIEHAERHQRRRLYVVGVAKHSKVLSRYRLAMALEDILAERFPCYLRVPRDLERKAYVWPEYAKGADEGEGGEAPKFVAGVMYLVKFGRERRDPIWAVDILDFQAQHEALIFGHLLADALDGFPVALYPRCLQRAHENAALVDFDMDILEQEVFEAVRAVLPRGKADALDTLRLHGDPANQRYE